MGVWKKITGVFKRPSDTVRLGPIEQSRQPQKSPKKKEKRVLPRWRSGPIIEDIGGGITHVNFRKNMVFLQSVVDAVDPITRKMKRLNKENFVNRRTTFYGKSGQLDL